MGDLIVESPIFSCVLQLRRRVQSLGVSRCHEQLPRRFTQLRRAGVAGELRRNQRGQDGDHDDHDRHLDECERFIPS